MPKWKEPAEGISGLSKIASTTFWDECPDPNPNYFKSQALLHYASRRIIVWRGA